MDSAAVESSKKEKARARQRKYKKTDKAKAANKRYRAGKAGKAARRRYQDSEKGKALNRRQNASDLCRQRKLEWSRSAKGKAALAKQTLKKQQAQKQATPKWANKKEIKEFYKTRPKGKWVDHIHPILSENCCGLHVSWNLQYLDMRDNIRKGNSFDGTYENEGWRKTKK